MATTEEPQPAPAPLQLPATGVTGDGLVDLGADGFAAVVEASTVNFGLRSPGEQNALIGGFARWLHSLDGPVQILARAHRVDLAELAELLAATAPGLPDPALEQAATAHAAFLADLAASHELLARRITLAIRDTRGGGYATHRAAETARALGGCEVTAAVCDPAQTSAVLAAGMRATPPPTGLAAPDAVITGPPAHRYATTHGRP